MKKYVFVVFTWMSLQAGAQVKNFTLTNVVDNKTISLTDYASYAGVVIIFTSNDCPYDDYYTSRLKILVQNYQSKVPVLLVNSFIEPNESVEGMVKCANQFALTAPYLADKDQTLLVNLNAHKSPEAFLLQNKGGSFSIVYRGAIDDNPQVVSDVKNQYLKNAIDKILAGQTPDVGEVRPVGCNIRRK